ncbi:MAG: ABC transporter permease [Gemmatimonadales bacterium]|jgi:predicted permease
MSHHDEPDVQPPRKLTRHEVQRGDPFVLRAWRDARYAARRLARSPGFTLTAILSLALGIGANTAIFSAVNAVLIQKPPLERPGELVDIYSSRPHFAYGAFCYPDFEEIRDGTRDVFSALAAVRLAPVQADRAVQVETLFAELVSGDYFSVLGVQVELGRAILPEDDAAAGAHPVVVLGHGYWRRAFAGDRDVVGRQVRLNGLAYTVVGVAPEDYRGIIRGLAPAFFIPMAMVNEIQPGSGDLLTARGDHSLFIKGRLEPGVTVEQAAVSAAAVAVHLRQRYPSDWAAEDRIVLVPTRDVVVYPPVDRFIHASAWLLMVVVGLVLLIACANLASFLLARAMDRRKEIAVRLALGARRRTLVRQLLTETVLLGILGGAVGVPLGLWLLRTLLATDLPLPMPISLDLSLDAIVLGFSLLISLAAGALLGLAPALQSTRSDVAATLKDEAAGGGWRAKARLRNVLVAAQVAVSVTLLVGAGLFLRSFFATRAVDPGFGRDPAALLTIAVPANRYSEEEGRLFTSALLDRFRQMPGVAAVGLTSNIHLNMITRQWASVNIDGVEPPPGRDAHNIDRATVDAGFFDATGILIIRGRNFNDADHEDAPGVAIINEAMARRFWPGGDAIGRMLRRPDGRDWRVVGVASTAKIRSLGEAPRPFVYLPYSQSYSTWLTAVVKTSRDPQRMVLELTRAARQLDPDIWIWEAKTLEQHLGTMQLPARLSALLLSLFALLALTLASVGLYGIVSYAVSQRSREIGIRMSLGADAGNVVRMLMGSALRIVAVGGCVGLAAALFLARALDQLLFGVGSLDPVAFALVPVLLGGVATLAAYIPSRRASRVDPVVALRSE